MKKFAGFVFLAAAVFLFFFAKRTLAADQRETNVLIRRMVDSRERENTIASLKTTILLENFDVTSDELAHKDPGPEKAELAKNRADLAQLEKAEQMIGSAAVQESELNDLENHHWVILGEFVGSVVVALVGLGLVL